MQMTEGMCFGEWAIIYNIERSASAYVMEESHLFSIDKEKFKMIFAKWLFLATSLSDVIPAEQIVSAYRKRWQIELHFKRSKSLLRFHRLRRCSYNYAFSIVSIWLAVTAFVYLLFNTLFSRICRDISSFNVFSLFAFLIS